jgi:hypothetical protein
VLTGLRCGTLPEVDTGSGDDLICALRSGSNRQKESGGKMLTGEVELRRGCIVCRQRRAPGGLREEGRCG